MALDFLRHLKEIRDQDLQQDQAILYATLVLSHIDSRVLAIRNLIGSTPVPF